MSILGIYAPFWMGGVWPSAPVDMEGDTAGGNKPLPQFPGPGVAAEVKLGWAGDHFGPSNYQQGGYNLTAKSLDFAGIEIVQVSSQTQSNNYYAVAIYPPNSSFSEFEAPTFSSLTLKWYYSANSVEVANNTNLSGEVMRLLAQGI